MLNNREIAILVWLAALLLWTLRSASVRESLLAVLRSLTHRKILTPLFVGAAYVSLAVVILNHIGIWTSALLKDTVFWFVFTGAATAFSLVGTWKGESLLRHLAADALKITIVVEFLTSEYTLSLPVELALVPILFLLGGMNAVAGDDPKYAPVKRLIVFLQIALGLLIVIVAFRSAIADWKNVQTFATLWKFLLPPLLSILFVPFAYGLLLYTLYDSLFARLHIGSPDAAFRARARRRLVKAFGISLSALHRFSNGEGRRIYSVRVDSDLDELLDRASLTSHGGRG